MLGNSLRQLHNITTKTVRRVRLQSNTTRDTRSVRTNLFSRNRLHVIRPANMPAIIHQMRHLCQFQTLRQVTKVTVTLNHTTHQNVGIRTSAKAISMDIRGPTGFVLVTRTRIVPRLVHPWMITNVQLVTRSSVISQRQALHTTSTIIIHSRGMIMIVQLVALNTYHHFTYTSFAPGPLKQGQLNGSHKSYHTFRSRFTTKHFRRMVDRQTKLTKRANFVRIYRIRFAIPKPVHHRR